MTPSRVTKTIVGRVVLPTYSDAEIEHYAEQYHAFKTINSSLKFVQFMICPDDLIELAKSDCKAAINPMLSAHIKTAARLIRLERARQPLIQEVTP